MAQEWKTGKSQPPSQLGRSVANINNIFFHEMHVRILHLNFTAVLIRQLYLQYIWQLDPILSNSFYAYIYIYI